MAEEMNMVQSLRLIPVRFTTIPDASNTTITISTWPNSRPRLNESNGVTTLVSVPSRLLSWLEKAMPCISPKNRAKK